MFRIFRVVLGSFLVRNRRFRNLRFRVVII